MAYFLNLEWLKWRKSKSFVSIVVLYLLLLPTFLLLLYNLPEFPKGSPFGSKEEFLSFPGVWKYLAYAGGWTVYFTFGIFSVLFITLEFEYRTFKQNIISGLERYQFFLGKVYFAFIIAIVATLYYILCVLGIGLLQSTEPITMMKITENSNSILLYFIMIIGYMSLGILVGTIFKKTGLALLFYFMYSMFLESVIRWVFHNSIVSNRSIHFYPVKSLGDILKPLDLDQMMGSSAHELFLSTNEALITSIIYTILFFLFSYLLIKRSDL